VLSSSSEAYDCGAKFAYYRQLESLREYLLVSQDAPRLELFTRRGDVWELRIAAPGHKLKLEVGGELDAPAGGACKVALRAPCRKIRGQQASRQRCPLATRAASSLLANK
jgi:hypothetical protein